MTRGDPETSAPAFLGSELRRARVAAGFSTQEALAARIGFDRTVLAKAETGQRPPSDEVLAAWCAACRLDVDMFRRMAVLARRAEGPVPTWFEDFLRAEGEAQTLRIWQPLIIPGLLQIPEYARALFLAVGADDARADELVALRMERQSILDRAEPPHLVTVLEESVLYKLIASAAVMYEQLIHLASMAGRPNISVQIVPASNGANAGLSGGFQIASCESAPDVLSMDGVQDVTEERRSLVRQATLIFDLVRADALPRTASRALILEAAEKWKT